MSKKKFQELVLAAYPELSLVGNHFYFNEYSNAISGFALSRATGGQYISWYTYLLSDPHPRIHLSVGNRLEGLAGFLQEDSNSKNSAGVFIEKVAPYINRVQDLSSAKCFIAYLRTESILLENPMILLPYGIANLLVDDLPLAEKCIINGLIASRKYRSNETNMQLDELLFSIKCGDIERSKNLVSKWEMDKQRFLGI